MKTKYKNIVFIVIDTHRKDRLGMYGCKRKTSPNLDHFASQGTIFENAVSPAQWTIPAHASMFSGEYPSVHQTNQSGLSLDPYFRTIAEYLSAVGYQTNGFCNNPLVGVLDNGLKRGFHTFYNYGGAFPSIPATESKGVLSSLGQLWERYTQLLRRISYPIQNAVAKSEKILKLSLKPIFVPLWISFANFKGDTVTSIRDTTNYLQRIRASQDTKPQFVFLNLMETHLPFTPPEEFTKRFVPYLDEERAAKDFMRVYNTKALRWLLPMEEPFSSLEFETLSDFYDAEVAYQDHLMGRLLEELNSSYHQENTMVIIVADHGEMLGENNFMGHSFRLYPELIHVPLIIRYAGQYEAKTVKDITSTTQLFHTIIDHAEVFDRLNGKSDREKRLEEEIFELSLKKKVDSQYNANLKEIFSEAFPPENVIKILENHDPLLIEKFSVRSKFNAVYSQEGYKMIRADGFTDQIFKINFEKGFDNLIEKMDELSVYIDMDRALREFLNNAKIRQPDHWSNDAVSVEDEIIKQRLRNLGYLE